MDIRHQVDGQPLEVLLPHPGHIVILIAIRRWTATSTATARPSRRQLVVRMRMGMRMRMWLGMLGMLLVRMWVVEWVVGRMAGCLHDGSRLLILRILWLLLLQMVVVVMSMHGDYS